MRDFPPPIRRESTDRADAASGTINKTREPGDPAGSDMVDVDAVGADQSAQADRAGQASRPSFLAALWTTCMGVWKRDADASRFPTTTGPTVNLVWALAFISAILPGPSALGPFGLALFAPLIIFAERHVASAAGYDARALTAGALFAAAVSVVGANVMTKALTALIAVTGTPVHGPAPGQQGSQAWFFMSMVGLAWAWILYGCARVRVLEAQERAAQRQPQGSTASRAEAKQEDSERS